MMMMMIMLCTIPVWIKTFELQKRQETCTTVLPGHPSSTKNNYNYKTKNHTRIKLRATNLQKKMRKKRGEGENSCTIFCFDVSLAVVGEAVLFLLRAQRWSGSRSQRPVSVVAALGSAESCCCCCNHFRPGHNQQVALSNYHNLISTTRIVL